MPRRAHLETKQNWALWHLLLLPLFLLGVASSASSHFLRNLNFRILHVEHHADGLKVYLRTPMPYLVADRIGPVGFNGLPEPAPYTTNLMEEGKLDHYVDRNQLRRDPNGLGAFAAQGFRLVVGGTTLKATVEPYGELAARLRVPSNAALAVKPAARNSLTDSRSPRCKFRCALLVLMEI